MGRADDDYLPYSGYCFKVITESLDFNVARQRCQNTGDNAYLASVRSGYHNSLIELLLIRSGLSSAWIGLESSTGVSNVAKSVVGLIPVWDSVWSLVHAVCIQPDLEKRNLYYCTHMHNHLPLWHALLCSRLITCAFLQNGEFPCVHACIGNHLHTVA